MRFLYTFILLGLLWPAAGLTASKKNPLDSYAMQVAAETDLPVLLVTVTSMPAGTWTNGNPPTPELNISRLLRGDQFPWDMKAIWKPYPYDASWAGEAEQIVLDVWRKKPLNAPAVKSKWFVTGNLVGDVFHVSPVMRYPSSGAVYKVLGPMVYNKPEKQNAASLNMIEMSAGRQARLEEWYKFLAESNPAELAKQSKLVAFTKIFSMDHSQRMVRFNVQSLAKQDDGLAETPSTIALAGFPLELYGKLYDYHESGTTMPLALFLNYGFVYDENGAKTLVYKPVDADYTIQPVTPELNKTLGLEMP